MTESGTPINEAYFHQNQLAKAPTGINGLDEITDGGLPIGRTTLVCGSAGSGKTLMAMQFLAQGALRYGEPGVFMAFEETAEDLAKNFASMGLDLRELVSTKKLLIDYVHIDPSEIEETGDYDLEGLFIRLGSAIDSIGAKRVVLDTIEVLFSGFRSDTILRSELRRLFRWLKDRGVTAIATGERGDGTLTRYGLEEYVADCVILLDARVQDQIATRRLRVVKYRGSLHGTNEYPFLIEDNGISVLPITSLGLEHTASTERVSTGIERLDMMLGGDGYYRGSSVLISGTAGTGKTSYAAHFADAGCRRGERCLYFAFEESPSQILRNMRSIGINLDPWVASGKLQIRSMRPMAYGLEMHLASMHKIIEDFQPSILIVDPISNLINVGTPPDVKSMLTRMMDYLKTKGITSLCTGLIERENDADAGQGVSSLMDTWIRLSQIETSSERNRGLSIIKSRGMKHSNQIREFLLTDQSVKILDVYLGQEGGILMGSARATQEAKERAEIQVRRQDMDRKKRDLERKLRTLDAQMTVLQAEFKKDEEELKKMTSEGEMIHESQTSDRGEIARLRGADV